jgi:hypothetical protein
MIRFYLLTEEEHKAIEKVTSVVRNHIYEAETGMPAISQWLPPADAGRG